jgi:enoyl-CoA hydratase/carnithine racemase
MVTVDTDLLVVKEAPDLVTVELARPEKLNALAPPMVRGLADAFEQLEDDKGRAVLLTGQGRATCAGMDEDIVSDDYAEEHGDLHGTLQGVYRQVEAHPGPVGLAGHGAVIGAAMLVSLSCEFVVVGEGTTLAIPEVSYGIASDRAASVLPGYVGRHVASELVLTGEPLAPERAREVGLVNDVVEEDADAVRERARELLGNVTRHDGGVVADVIGKMPSVES